VEDDLETGKMFKDYFNLLDKHSFTIIDYEEYSRKHYDFEYKVEPTTVKVNENQHCLFSAPFIKYNGSGSNHYIQDKIINFIRTAKKRIFSCSQHFMDIESFDFSAKSILDTLREVSVGNSALEIKVLKQTRAENQAQGKRTLKAEQYLKNIKNAEQRFLSPVIHDKFIIVDNKILVMTANITPTQYAWRYPHTMKYAVEEKVYEINNCFSEINSFHFIEDSELTNRYYDHYMQLWKMANKI
jgi:phosphatidylserine/phosphatidylglycerophosphate/cardiolipin synthase-like enzyme